MITGIRHVGMAVKDLDTMLDFYCRLLGFKETTRMEESGEFIESILGMKDAKLTTVKLAAPDGGVIELVKFHSHEPENDRDIFTYGLTHIALAVSDLDFQYRVLRGEGVRMTSLPMTSLDRLAKVCFCMDPEGNIIELVELLH